VGQNDAANRPTRLRTAWYRWHGRAREVGFQRSRVRRGQLANPWQPTERRWEWSPTVFNGDLEEQKVLATGVYGTHLVSVRGSYDDVNRLVH